MLKIRVLVADDHTLFRQGIVSLLGAQPDMEVIGEACNGKEAILEAIKELPDIVLMDIGMPGINGLDATKEIKKQIPKVEVLILTMHDREDYLFQSLQAGAAGYLLKGADVNELLSAIRSAKSGVVYLYPTIIKRLLADYLCRAKSGEKGTRYDGLTDRQREVLVQIAGGKTLAEIAQILYLSPHTVQTHRDNIMKKLDLHNKAELIKYAIRKGLIDTK